MKTLIALLMSLAIAGDTAGEAGRGYEIIADVPLALRVKNWPDAGGSGSCVNASTIVCLNWAGLEATAEWWPWEGGETLSSCTQHLEISRVQYCVERGDSAIRLMRWAAANRIPAAIPFKPRHFCNLLDFDNDGRCVVLDNNSPSGYEVYTTAEFLAIWEACGAYAAVVVSPPPPPWPQ